MQLLSHTKAYGFGCAGQRVCRRTCRCTCLPAPRVLRARRFRQLLDYIAQWGDTAVGYRDGDDPELARWASKQRSEHRRGQLHPTRWVKCGGGAFVHANARASSSILVLCAYIVCMCPCVDTPLSVHVYVPTCLLAGVGECAGKAAMTLLRLDWAHSLLVCMCACVCAQHACCCFNGDTRVYKGHGRTLLFGVSQLYRCWKPYPKPGVPLAT